MRKKTETVILKDCLLWLILAAILSAQVFLRLGMTKVCGSSMASAFNEGKYVFTIKVLNCSNLKRGDIVTFFPEKDSSITYIKRIIGLPGEVIEARENTVLVDGKAVSFWHGTGFGGPVVIPDDTVFVLGDNRGASCDSRDLGCIPFARICTKVIGKDVLLS